MKLKHFTLLVAGTTLALTSCKNKETDELIQPDPLAMNRDTTISPGEDFFHYTNGGWFKKNPIPETESSNGIFRTIGDTINSQIKSICIKSAEDKNTEKGSNKQKIGDFYASGMDSIAIEKAGINPLKAEMARIDAVKDLPSLTEAIAHMHTIGTNPAFGFYLGQDDKNSTKYALFFSQGGLGLGDRDYYFNTDEETVNIRKEYVKHVQAMLQLIGQTKVPAVKNSHSIIE